MYFFYLNERMNYYDVVLKLVFVNKIHIYHHILFIKHVFVFVERYLYILKMPINVFGISSKNSDHKIETSLFVPKPYLRTNYIEANIEEDIDLKNQCRIKNLHDLISITEACSKN